MVGDAQLAVLKSQHEFARAIKLKSGEPLPLTVDRPHVGDYNTAFDTLFAERTPPPHLRLIHRTLPIRRKGIDEHSNAIQHGLDALDAIEDEYGRKATDIDTLLAAWEHVAAKHKAFIASVRRYNQEIAEYALNTAKQGIVRRTRGDVDGRRKRQVRAPRRTGSRSQPQSPKTTCQARHAPERLVMSVTPKTRGTNRRRAGHHAGQKRPTLKAAAVEHEPRGRCKQ